MADGGEHAALLELEASAHRDVQQLAGTSLADKARSQQLSAGIQDKMARIRALTRDLELEVEELDGDEERAALAAQLAGHKREYAGLQAALKDAALAQRTAALRSAQEERKELLTGGEAGLRQRRAQLEGDAVAAAEEVTGGLRRTRQVLAEELEHTSATLAAMEASHTALGRTRDEYHGQHRKLRRSKGLLGTLNWQNKSETYMLWTGLTLFLVVCAYIVQKRAGHFIPEPLKPSNLLAGLRGPLRVGRPLAAPQPHGPRAEPRLQPDHHPSPPQPLQYQPPAVQRQEVDAEAAAAVGRGRAPPQDALRQPPQLPPEDAPAGSGEGLEATPHPYGGFTDQEEPGEESQPVYQPADASAARQAVQQGQGQAAAVQEHPPAEWPSGAPGPRPEEQQQQQQQQQQVAGEMQASAQDQEQQGGQDTNAPLGQEPAAAARQEPRVDDLTLPEVGALQAASMAADITAGQVAAAAQAERAAAAEGQQAGGAEQGAGKMGGQPAGQSGTLTSPEGGVVAVDGPNFMRGTQPAEEGEPLVADRLEASPSGSAEEHPGEHPAAELGAQQGDPEQAGEQPAAGIGGQQAEPEQPQEQQQMATGAAEVRPGEAGGHAPAEWPSGAPEPRDEL